MLSKKEKDAFIKVISHENFEGLHNMIAAVSTAYGSNDKEREDVKQEITALCGAMLYRFGLHPSATKKDFEYFFFAISLLTKFITHENNKGSLVKPTAAKGDFGAN